MPQNRALKNSAGFFQRFSGAPECEIVAENAPPDLFNVFPAAFSPFFSAVFSQRSRVGVSGAIPPPPPPAPWGGRWADLAGAQFADPGCFGEQ